jgi:hypothetical protein
MEEIITIDPSLSGYVHIDSIGYDEVVSIYYDSNTGQDWADDYLLTVYNSPQKNSKIELPDAITKDGARLTVVFKPKDQTIGIGNSYYEIFNTVEKRVEAKGDLKVRK